MYVITGVIMYLSRKFAIKYIVNVDRMRTVALYIITNKVLGVTPTEMVIHTPFASMNIFQ